MRMSIVMWVADPCLRYVADTGAECILVNGKSVCEVCIEPTTSERVNNCTSGTVNLVQWSAQRALPFSEGWILSNISASLDARPISHDASTMHAPIAITYPPFLHGTNKDYHADDSSDVELKDILMPGKNIFVTYLGPRVYDQDRERRKIFGGLVAQNT
eukprot:g70310.t1